MGNINYYKHDESEYLLDAEIQFWLNKCLNEIALEIEQLNYIFCTDNELLEVNKTYLNHDYYTDIITFDLRDSPDEPVLADLYLSLDRIKDNAQTNNIANSLELKRVMIHGILHICGYSDKTPEDTATMREKENYFIYL